jgi:3-isopropylmalate/(R)-2-methylmalate dehydratase large subunit
MTATSTERMGSRPNARTIIEKIWDQHVVADLGHGSALLHLDRIFMHEKTGGRMLRGVREGGRQPARPELVFGTFDHVIDTKPGRDDTTLFPGGAEFIGLYRDEARRVHVPLIEIDDPRQGIVHVVSPELGIALPGTTFVCGDSHTSTVGAVGALAWGIGVTQGEHAIATQTLRQRWPGTMRVRFDGRPGPGVSAKDLALALIGSHGATGGRGRAIELTGPAIEALDMAGRMTLCNMAVEFDAWTAIIAPDDKTLAFLEGTEYAPAGAAWDQAVASWRRLPSDDDAHFDDELTLDAGAVAPQVTWGTSPEHVVAIDGVVPDPSSARDAAARAAAERALAYSALTPGTAVETVPVDAAFIGSCTNSRLEDLRAAAAILRGRRVAEGVLAICVPGSTAVKRAAEAEGLDEVFREAGFEWRESGCSLCVYIQGDSFGTAQRVISTTNRNFENRQGAGVRSHLASPATVAASAVTGHITDPRRLAPAGPIRVLTP